MICIELEAKVAGKEQKRIKAELEQLAAQNPVTDSIKELLFHPSFPVDIRHNAKIFREKLALWAAEKLS